jgi:predicted amidophosphoribosyltransferase
MGENLLRDAIELLIVVAIGGLLWQTIGRLRRGEISVHRCPVCDRPTSRAYPMCRHCGAPLGER